LDDAGAGKEDGTLAEHHEKRQVKHMVNVTFRYADELSGWEWRTQSCFVRDVEECKRIYGLEKDDCKYEILQVEELDD
jgi:hypothetical protein